LLKAGISSKGLNFGAPENKKKYNGIEKEDALGIEIYDAKLRELDPQIGRWWEIDPKVENMEMWSPYASNYDNPIRYSDPLGDEGEDC
jgi:RHS repeat-associated protein